VNEQDLHMNHLLEQMVAIHASDLFLSSGAFIQARVDGNLQALTEYPLSPGLTMKLANQILTPAQMQLLEETHELNIGYVERGVGRFRVNFFKQRGEIAIVARHIKTVTPPPPRN